MVAIAITRMDLTATELRAASAKRRDAPAARQMLALALVLEGVDRMTAAEICGMIRQTLRDWVHRYNADGLAGLSNHRGAPRPRRLDPGQVSEFVAWLEAGPDPAGDGVVRWRRQDLQRRITGRFGVELHERTVGKYLAALGYRRLSVRPRHPKTQDAFKKLPRGGSGGNPEGGARQSARALVPERGTGRPAGHAYPDLGKARHAAARAARHPLPVGRSPSSSNQWRTRARLRRCLPRARLDGGSRHALHRHPRDE
jgi:transposase